MNHALALEWLKSAHSDILLIEAIVDHPNLTHMVAFHAQQCIEKVLKGVLDAHGEKVPKKQDLLALKDLVTASFPLENEEVFEDLNELYIDSIYPGELGLLPHGQPSTDDANIFYTAAKEIFFKACVLLKINTEEFKI